ncbi:zinc finger protein 716-like [Homarus americanus]|uniref:zinc finger protein 716-like n=1 Tax=Homarus americanus TaxID=6706 RepID=UPI001C490435|nr:zinc finger protein 716-like [Homarus americanus]
MPDVGDLFLYSMQPTMEALKGRALQFQFTRSLLPHSSLNSVTLKMSSKQFAEGSCIWEGQGAQENRVSGGEVHLDEDGVEVGNAELMSNNTLPLYCCKTCNLACLSVHRFNTHTCRLPTDDENTTSTLSNRILITNVLKLHKLRKFVCETCGVEYRTFKRITYHLPRCSPGPYPCNVCALLFTTQKELNYHKKKFHKDEKCFVCEERGKIFQRRTPLQKHAPSIWKESNSRSFM